jgi:hypothetical protein
MEVEAGYACTVDPTQWCEICFQLDGAGNPIISTAVRTPGRYLSPLRHEKFLSDDKD